LRWLDGRPVDLLGERDRSDVDQAAVLDRLVLVVLEREPVDRLRLRVDDQDLVDVAGGVQNGSFSQLSSPGETISTTSAAVANHSRVALAVYAPM
jgi:hypothetical protein